MTVRISPTYGRLQSLKIDTAPIDDIFEANYPNSQSIVETVSKLA